ncbi:hypothetical protein H8959_016974 [Pygathrix nigripes]
MVAATTAALDKFPFRAPHAGDKGKMSVSVFKAKLEFTRSRRSSHSAHAPLQYHREAPSGGLAGQGAGGEGARSPETKGSLPRRGPGSPGETNNEKGLIDKEKVGMQPLVLFERSFSTGLAACCCVLERRIVPWMRQVKDPVQESYSSSSPIWFVDSDEPNLTSVLECLEDTKNNNSVRKEAKLFSLFLMNMIFRN